MSIQGFNRREIFDSRGRAINAAGRSVQLKQKGASNRQQSEAAYQAFASYGHPLGTMVAPSPETMVAPYPETMVAPYPGTVMDPPGTMMDPPGTMVAPYHLNQRPRAYT